MRIFIQETRGISVIIGALMLTLIVVTAATTFAIFTSQKQKEIQNAEYFKLQKSLEDVSITSIEQLAYQGVPPNLNSLNFHISNMHAADSVITSLNINEYYLRQFTIKRQDYSIEKWSLDLTTGNYLLHEPYVFTDSDGDHKYSSGEPILNDDPNSNGIIATPQIGENGGLQAIDISGEPYIFQDLNGDGVYNTNEPILNYDPDNNLLPAYPVNSEVGNLYMGGLYGFDSRPGTITILSKENILLSILNVDSDLLYAQPIYKNDAITMNIYTTLLNTFSKTFIPPTAVITITTESQWDPSLPGYNDFIILDGSQSDHPGIGQIVQWNWDFAGAFPQESGRKIRAPAGITSGGPYTITLIVTDTYGMSGSTSIEYP